MHGVTLEVRAGEIVALIGANGAGKTTTLRAVSGTAAGRAGAIDLDGRAARAAWARRPRSSARHRPRSRGPPALSHDDRAGEPRARGADPGAGRAAGPRRWSACPRPVPAAGRAAGPAGRHAVGRRAADGRDRAGADGAAPAAHARRAVAGPGPGDGGLDLRQPRRDQPRRADHPAGRAERPAGARRCPPRLRPGERDHHALGAERRRCWPTSGSGRRIWAGDAGAQRAPASHYLLTFGPDDDDQVFADDRQPAVFFLEPPGHGHRHRLTVPERARDRRNPGPEPGRDSRPSWSCRDRYREAAPRSRPR